MANDVRIVFKAENQQATREIQNLRATMLQLNKTINEQRHALIGASKEEQQTIRAHIAANNASKATLRTRIEELNLQKQAIAQAQRETRAREQAAKAQVRALERVRAEQQRVIADASMAAGIVSYQLAQLTQTFIQSAANMETFRASLNAVTGNAEETNAVLADLLDLTVELVGIDTGVLISFAARLQATGLSADAAITTIRGVTERVAEQGKSAEVTTRVLEQLTQAINSNTISAQDFRPIMRELPTLFQDASNALGVQIRSLEDFRDAAESVGGPVEAIILLTEEMGRASQGADLNTLNAQLDILQDQARILAANLGEHLLPAAVAIVKQINEWIEQFNNMDKTAQAAIAWAAALATGLSALTAVVGGTVVAFGALNASLAAITGAGGLGGVVAIGGQAAGVLGKVVSVLAKVGSVGGIAVTAIATLVQAWREIYDSFNKTRPFEDAVESLEAIDIAASETAKSLGLTTEAFGRIASETQEHVRLLIGRADELRNSIRNAVNSGDTGGLSGLRSEYRGILEELEALTEKIEDAPLEELTEEGESLEIQMVRVADALHRARDAFSDLSDDASLDSIQATARQLTQALESELHLQLQNAELTSAERLQLELEFARETEAIHREMYAKIRDLIDADAEAYARAAEKRIEARQQEVQAQEDILRNAGFFDALADPLEAYAAGLQATSESADAAFGSLNRVAEIVKDADFNRAESELRDFDDAFQLSKATIPEVRSEMVRFTGTLPDATQGLRDTTIALRNFSQEAQTAARDTEALNASFAAIDAFDPRTPNLNAQSTGGFDTVGFAAETGAELVGIGLETAGELRRIEEERVQSLEDLEREYSEKIIAINEEKRRRLEDVERQIEEERVRRLAAIQQAFDDAAAAEIEARERAAERIQRIEERAAEARERLRARITERLIELEERRDERIQDINDAFLERERDRQARILEITEKATADRARAEQRYADEVQSINNNLVEAVLAIQSGLLDEIEALNDAYHQRQAAREAEITRLTEQAAADRAAAHQNYADTMQGIYNDLVDAWDALEDGFTRRQADRAQQRIAIEERAADDRIAAYQNYNNTVGRISTDLVDEIRGIQDEITEVIENAAEERARIEAESVEARAEAEADYSQTLVEIEADRIRDLEENARRQKEIRQRAIDDRLDAEDDFADAVQRIQNDLVDEVIGIEEELNDTLNELRDERLEAEQDRADSLVELHEDAQQKLEDLERDQVHNLEDLRRNFQRDQLDAAEQLQRDLEDAEGDPEKEEAARKKYQRKIEDLTREFFRRQIDFQRQQQREREAIARETAATEVKIAEDTQEKVTGIEQQETEAKTTADTQISEAETEAGIDFETAQANYVPALSAHQQALVDHTEALKLINEREATELDTAEADRTKILQDSLTDAAAAGKTFTETLLEINRLERLRIGTLTTETATTVTGLNQEITDAETRTGLTFEQALVNYVPNVDLNTQALNTLTETITGINQQETADLTAITQAETEDRTTTTAQQTQLETEAGVTIGEARENYVPALSRAAEATETLNQTLLNVDSTFAAAIEAIQAEGLIDSAKLATDIITAVATANTDIAALETAAGTTFAEASTQFVPEGSLLDQAEARRDSAITQIDDKEISDIEDINTESVADRLATDAEITATRDAYIKARDLEIFKHNQAILKINIDEAKDIKDIRDTLKTELADINETLDLELEEIRAAKTVFDTKINELIEKINTDANVDVASLKEDTAVMRTELEDIAEEARNNAWKDAILKVANVGITVAGFAAGTALGNPAAGLAVGQTVGGLVQQGGEELFHYESTDRIARNIARAAGLSSPQPRPNYLPSPDQLRNARDVGREVVAGYTEGLAARQSEPEATPTSGTLSDEQNVTIVLQFPDGSTQELANQVLRLREQGRTLL